MDIGFVGMRRNTIPSSLMSAMEDDNFDYPAYTRESPPHPAKILRGTAERQRRFDAAMVRLSSQTDVTLQPSQKKNC